MDIVSEIGRTQRMKANNATAEIVQVPSSVSEPEAGVKPDGWEGVVRRLVNSLRFGVVQITVHESHVVQVERTEKVRFAPPLSHKSNR